MAQPVLGLYVVEVDAVADLGLFGIEEAADDRDQRTTALDDHRGAWQDASDLARQVLDHRRPGDVLVACRCLERAAFARRVQGLSDPTTDLAIALVGDVARVVVADDLEVGDRAVIVLAADQQDQPATSEAYVDGGVVPTRLAELADVDAAVLGMPELPGVGGLLTADATGDEEVVVEQVGHRVVGTRVLEVRLGRGALLHRADRRVDELDDVALLGLVADQDITSGDGDQSTIAERGTGKGAACRELRASEA